MSTSKQVIETCLLVTPHPQEETIMRRYVAALCFISAAAALLISGSGSLALLFWLIGFLAAALALLLWFLNYRNKLM